MPARDGSRKWRPSREVASERASLQLHWGGLQLLRICAFPYCRSAAKLSRAIDKDRLPVSNDTRDDHREEGDGRARHPQVSWRIASRSSRYVTSSAISIASTSALPR